MSALPRRRATGRVTLNEVAEAAGVSPITASRALRGQRSVDTALAERVRTAAAQLGYVPDPAARALASQRSQQIAVLIPLLSNNLFVDVLEAAQAEFAPAGFQMLIGVTHYDPLEEETLLRSHLAHRPAGLLLTGFDRTEAARQLLAASGTPCVHLMENRSGDGAYSVGLSQTEAGAAVTRHLLDSGRRRIAFVGAQLDPRVMPRAAPGRPLGPGAGVADARPLLAAAGRGTAATPAGRAPGRGWHLLLQR
jgi:LacI family gluconate utilization system Gnt-I transcriptional repressor